MVFTRENAREFKNAPMAKLQAVFGDRLFGDACATPTDTEALHVVGACGMEFYAPVSDYILNTPELFCYIASFGAANHLFAFDGGNVRHYTDDGEKLLPEDTAQALISVYETVMKSGGTIGSEGEHIIDLKGNKIGTHYDVNLLIGNRIGFEYPMLTTPKGALDSLGRGSFRAGAARQVTATRYSLTPEYNGEPVNRQFYIVENGAQIFYSADVKANIKSAVCRHFRNYTEITYETECGLKIKRTLFILPHADGMPDATEAQRVEIENTTGKKRSLRIVFTGMFGLTAPESAMNDIIYASVIWESGVIKADGKTIAVSPSSHQKRLRANKRFALLLTDEGETLDGYTANYIDFIGNGSIEKPQRVACLPTVPVTKMVSFYAMEKAFSVDAGASRTVDSYTGYVFSPDATDGVLFDAVGTLVKKYKTPAALGKTLESVKDFGRKYAGFLKLETGDRDLDTYVNNNLPFQVYYQSYVSRSFAWTQKAYREIGFREIQDMYASLYYIIGMGEKRLAREMLGEWIKNVYEMGYANHNFYETGKEPGMCSDDGLWLAQAVYRYVSLTGDKDFLFCEFPVAGSDKKRTLLDTLLATVRYSGKISVGAHGIPLLDKSDWNDCLKLDNDWIDGIEKEKRYAAQLAQGGKYGDRFMSEHSESVMNAFLLKIAYDEIAEMARDAGMEETAAALENDCAALCENIRKHCWKGDFYARALLGGKRDGGYTYLGAGGDGLSADPAINGSYFLNSFSWSILAGVASEDEISVMLERVNKHLVCPAGVKLCSPCDLGKLATGNASEAYFPGDRENGGTFKHAAMMAASATLKASKTVKSTELAKALAEFAYFALDSVFPYKTLLHPYKTKGNPRFCTQYNNSITGENIGPMLSGTASWLNLSMMELLGFGLSGEYLVFSPVLPFESEKSDYTVNNGETSFHVHIEKPRGFARTADGAKMTFDGVPFDGKIKRPDDGKTHEVNIILK